VDRTRDGIPPLTGDVTAAVAGGYVDLHMHSTASDGSLAPEAVVARAAAAGLAAVALTDHDTVSGVPAALAAGREHGVRVVVGCEFSVLAPWGEMHVLGYFLPEASAELEEFLLRCRSDRNRRGMEMVRLLQAQGVKIDEDAVLAESAGGALGRPHVARALRKAGVVRTLDEAFDRFLGRGRSAYVEKALPTFVSVAALVHRIGGVVSAAHLKDRGSRATLVRLRADGLDAVETRHPSHDADVRARLTDLALELRLGRTGGSDWHGEAEDGWAHGALGSQQVPGEWLDQLEASRPAFTGG
jgi:predicted metal-dependent phosphoesterase TrpH